MREDVIIHITTYFSSKGIFSDLVEAIAEEGKSCYYISHFCLTKLHFLSNYALISFALSFLERRK